VVSFAKFSPFLIDSSNSNCDLTFTGLDHGRSAYAKATQHFPMQLAIV
jgi:hypothetical protein